MRVHNPVILRVRGTAREQAVRLASRNSGDEQRQHQRQLTVETRRQEVAQSGR